MESVWLILVGGIGYGTGTSSTGAELVFEVFSQRYQRGSTVVTSNLPFEDWTSVLGSERLTGALLDRLTHHVHILTMNGDSYRLKQSAGHLAAAAAAQNQATDSVDPDTGEIVTTWQKVPIGPFAYRHTRHPYWPAFTPPIWPGIRPALTGARGLASNPDPFSAR